MSLSATSSSSSLFGTGTPSDATTPSSTSSSGGGVTPVVATRREMTVVKSGFLWKRGGGQPSTAYRKRWMELRVDKQHANKPDSSEAHELAYFRSQGDAQAAGIVSFANPYHIFPTDIHPAKKRFFFVLAPTDEVRYAPKGGSSRVYYFLAESNEEMQDWLDALQTVIAGPAPCPLKVPSNPLGDIIKQGYLFKRGPNSVAVSNWRTRWLVLRKAPPEAWCRNESQAPFTLSYYQKVEDTEASGIVYLSEQYFVREEERGKDGRDFGFTVAPSDEEGSATRAFYLATKSKDDMDAWMDALSTAIEKTCMPSAIISKRSSTFSFSSDAEEVRTMPVSLNVSELTEDLLTPSDQLLLVSPAGSVVGDYDSTFSTHSSFLSPHFALQPAPRQPASGPISIPTRRDTQPPVLSSTPPKNPSPSSTKSSSDGFATPDSTPSTLILNDEISVEIDPLTKTVRVLQRKNPSTNTYTDWHIERKQV